VAAALGYDNWEELETSNYSRFYGENQIAIRLFVPKTDEETYWGGVICDRDPPDAPRERGER
jgi:hypothetical protein